MQIQEVLDQREEEEEKDDPLNQVSQEVLESASYRSDGMLRSMSATNMSMPFLDKVQVVAKKE